MKIETCSRNKKKNQPRMAEENKGETKPRKNRIIHDENKTNKEIKEQISKNHKKYQKRLVTWNDMEKIK